MNPRANDPTSHVIVLTRVFDAPRERVWQVWTDPKHTAAWWGPRGFSARIEKMELRVGGNWRYVMIDPDGTEYPAVGEFREVVPPERLVTTDEFPDDFEFGVPEDLPQGIEVTVLFGAEGRTRTRLTLEITHPTEDDRRKHEEMGVVDGWTSSLDCMEEYLATLT